jgi:hypothetical protein
MTYAAASATKNQTGTAAFKIRVYDTRVKGFLLPLIAGLGLAAVVTASPLTVLALPLAWWSSRSPAAGCRTTSGDR